MTLSPVQTSGTDKKEEISHLQDKAEKHFQTAV
jgi:hypothetical protein